MKVDCKNMSKCIEGMMSMVSIAVFPAELFKSENDGGTVVA